MWRNPDCSGSAVVLRRPRSCRLTPGGTIDIAMPTVRWDFLWTGAEWKRLASSRLSAWWHRGEAYAALAPYAGGEARYAELVVETARRVPLRVLRAGYYLLRVGADGRIDERARLAEMADAIAAGAGAGRADRADGNVVDVSGRLAVRRYWARHRWTPSPGEMDLLNAAIDRAAKRRIGRLPRFPRKVPLPG